MFHLDKLCDPWESDFFEVRMALIDWKLDFQGKCDYYPPCWGPPQPWKTHLFCPVLQMITTQKQLIENADAVQEKIAQVQREGMLFICWTGTLSKQCLYVSIIICVGLFSISEACLVPSVNMKQFFGKWTTNQPSHLITWLSWRLWVAEARLDRCRPVASVCFLQEWTFTRICLDSGRRRDWRDASWAKLSRVSPGTSPFSRYRAGSPP